MKKIFKSLLLTLILLLPVVVLADMGAPQVPSYEAIVISKDGADIYKYEQSFKKIGHLDEGKKIEIVYEMDEDGEIYLAFRDSDELAEAYIKASDVAPVKDNISPKDAGYKDPYEVGEFLVYAKEVELRSGPSISYKSVKKLKKGTKGKYYYYDFESSYIYVEVDGDKGWLNTLQKEVLMYKKDKLLLGIEFKNKCGTIPANTILDGGWQASVWDYTPILVKYNGCEGFIPNFKSTVILHLSEDNSKTYTAEKDMILFEALDSDNKVVTIPNGEKYKVIGITHEDVAEYIEYNGLKGWYSEFDEDYFKNYLDEKFNVVNDKIGDEKEDSDIQEEEKEEPVETIGAIDQEENDKKENVKEDKKESKMDSKDIITICCIAAGAFALGALATILLVNKKKDGKEEKKEEKKAEVKEEDKKVEEKEEESAEEDEKKEEDEE